MRFTTPKKAFTLVEMLVVIAVIAVLMALIFPAVRSGYNTSLSAKCVGNLRQISNLFLTYAGEHNGYFPKAASAAGYWGGTEWAPEHFMLDYDGFEKDEQGKIIQFLPPGQNSIFRCPAETSDVDAEGNTWFQSHYGYNRYLVTQIYSPIFGTNPCRIPVHAVQRPSKVFLVADARNRFAIHSGALIPKRRHRNGTHANVAFVDGHVETTDHIPWAWAQYIEWGGERESSNAPSAPYN